MKPNMMKKAQELQNKLSEIMASVRGEATSGGGMVKAVADGKGSIIELNIETEVIDPADKRMLEDLVIAAVNEARKKAQQQVQAEAQNIIGVPLPGLF